MDGTKLLNVSKVNIDLGEKKKNKFYPLGIIFKILRQVRVRRVLMDSVVF